MAVLITNGHVDGAVSSDTAVTVDGNPPPETVNGKLVTGSFRAGMKVKFGVLPAGGSLTFTGAALEGETITIVTADGTSNTYTCGASQALGASQFVGIGSAAAAATSLKDCIDHVNGHLGKITVVDDSSGGLTLTQDAGQEGTEGNKGITSGLSNVTVVQFNGGTDTATTTVDDWTTTSVTLGDALDIDDDAPMWKVYEGYHGNQEEHSRKYTLGYI